MTDKEETPEINRATQYALDVVAGKIVANAHVTASCQRHLNDLKRKDIKFCEKTADRVFKFFETILKLNGGKFEGKPFILQPCQAFIVGSLFGWKRFDGKRRFRRAYIEIGKGNGKTPLVAGIGLYGLLADNENRAEVYAAASKFDQAKILFRDAKAMVEMSKDLNDLCLVSGGEHTPNIAYFKKSCFFRPISSDKTGQSGPRPHFALCDELHEHVDGSVVEMLERGFKFREQPLLLMITNSGFNQNSVCYEEHEHAVKVAHGDIDDDTTFSFVCGMDDGDDPLTDESVWIKANPLLGVILTKTYIRGVVKQANAQPGKRNGILRLHFCEWTESENVWMDRKLWTACETEPEDFKPDYSQPCYGALDLSYKRDLTACARVWKASDGTYDAIVDFWTPYDTINDREEKDRVPYRTWIADSHVRTTPSSTVDYAHIIPTLGQFHAESEFGGVAYDRWRIDLIKNAMDEQGLDLKLVEHGQGFKDMSPAIDAIESAIMNHKLRVLYNPCLRWNVASAVVQEDPAGGRKFAKNKSTGRIDGLVALTMAIALAEKDEYGSIDEFLNNPIKGRW